MEIRHFRHSSFISATVTKGNLGKERLHFPVTAHHRGKSGQGLKLKQELEGETVEEQCLPGPFMQQALTDSSAQPAFLAGDHLLRKWLCSQWAGFSYTS